MADDTRSAERRARYERWFADLAARDPRLHRELSGRLSDLKKAPAPGGLSLESVGGDQRPPGPEIALETIVREGRPALPIRNHQIITGGVEIEASARAIVERLTESAATIQPVIPLVGRIDVANFPGSLSFVGTGWLVDRDIVVTNRHVAELLASPDGAEFVFRPGRLGDDLAVSIDWFHEFGRNETSAVPVARVIWIEEDRNKADIAFLELKPGAVPDGRPPRIALADADAAENTEVAVVGYPARAPAHVVPDQVWMDRIYASTYDVKRIAPGLAGPISRGWATHDCTTLGGNSGSVVLDMKTGHALALHFAGLYLIENYAVPASTIRAYLKARPWHGGRVPERPAAAETSARPPTPARPADPNPAPGAVSVTVPLVITLTLGQPQVGSPANATIDIHAAVSAAVPASIDEAARLLARQRVAGVVDVWPGYLIRDGRLSDDDCLVVSADPARLDAVRAAMPARFGAFPVDVRAATIAQLPEAVAEGVTSIAYNDDDRTGAGFSFEPITEDMVVKLHVGPERSWVVLEDFLKSTKRRLVSSIYEFHATHIARAIEDRLRDVAMKLVIAIQSRDRNGPPPAGDFERGRTFDRWAAQFGDKFKRIFVPIGTNGLVANSYHIKVSVRDDGDDAAVWLSSGNWKRHSQPVIAAASLDDPGVTTRAGNREWHVVAHSPTLAERFRNHILADFEQSKALGGTLEAVEEQSFVDVPLAALESPALEGPAARVLQPGEISGRITVTPLLTPDQRGAVYSNAVLELIRSAKKQLLFQNQYIRMKGATSGFLQQLVDALIERSKTIKDVRIILRSGDLGFDVSQLKRRGMNVDKCVRQIANTHTKGIVVDGRRVLVGSHNWSADGVTLNRDASLIFDHEEIAQYFAEAFQLDWDRSNPVRLEETPALEAPRLAVGPAPPPGFKRIPLSEYLED